MELFDRQHVSQPVNNRVNKVVVSFGASVFILFNLYLTRQDRLRTNSYLQLQPGKRGEVGHKNKTKSTLQYTRQYKQQSNKTFLKSKIHTEVIFTMRQATKEDGRAEMRVSSVDLHLP